MDKASAAHQSTNDAPKKPLSSRHTKPLSKASIPKFESNKKQTSSRKPRSSLGASKGRKRTRAHVEEDEDEENPKRMKVDEVPDERAEVEDEEDSQTFTQPGLITGARLKKYQLEGVAWMAGLYQNGISGILGTSTSAFAFTSATHKHLSG